MKVKFLLALLTFNFALLTFALPVNAQQSNPYLQPNTNPDVPQNLNTWTQNVMISLMSAGVCQLTGINPTDPNQACLGLDSTTGKVGFIKQEPSPDGTPKVGGAIGLTGTWIAATFTHPPASTTEYLSYMGGKFGIVEPAYAQGTGFKGLSPLIKIWEAFRNLVYILFVLVFVAIGLMIMLRVKIDPRTVMTIQNSIPKLIIALVLVTLSFAIAGFLIDLMYVTIFLVFGFFGGMDIYAAGGKIHNVLEDFMKNYQGQSIMSILGSQTGIGLLGIIFGAAGAVKDSIVITLGPDPSGGGGAAGGAGGLLGSVAFQALVRGLGAVGVASGLFTGGVGTFVTIVLGTVIGAALGGFTPEGKEVLGLGAGFIAFFIIAIAVFVSMFRLLFALIMAYIQILINVVFAPVWILGGAIPGSPISFSAWLRTIIANLSAFPATIFMLLLGKAFIEGMGGSPVTASGSGFVPPLIGAQSVEAIKGFIGLGIVLLTPQVVNMLKEALKSPQLKYGAAIGMAIGMGPAAAGSVAHTVASPYGALQQFRTGPIGKFLGAPGGWGERLKAAAKTTEEVAPHPNKGSQG